MKTCFSNATVMWNEHEIIFRENLIREIPCILKTVWTDLNSAVKFERCETPILTPADKLLEHISTGFNLIGPCSDRGYLRPETTAGTYEAFSHRVQPESLKKQLPFCMWQVGLSFRDEKNPDTMRASKLRLTQFYQMEFQLFASHGTKAPYLETALTSLTNRFGGTFRPADELPHYSEKTLDWYIDDLEVAGCSVRRDWSNGMVFEVAIGLDRLVALLLKHNSGN
jgi:hypothetical protein